jgi:CIC family chloride channel protein
MPAFLMAALVVGILVGLAATLLVVLIDLLRDAGEALDQDWGSWVLIVLVPGGILLAWLIARVVGQEVESGGVTETMVGLSLHGGYLSTKTVFAKLAATASTLGAGGSGGSEGPIVMIGGAIGSSLARYTRFGEDRIRSLLAAGAGAGIGASFAAPIAGMLFAMEVLLQNFSIRHLNAVVVASVAAAVTTGTLLGDELLLRAPAGLRLGGPSELLLYAVLGLVVVAVALAYLRILDVVARQAARLRRRDWVRPVAAGLVVAVIGLLAPEVLFTGVGFLSDLLRGDADKAIWVLVGFAVFKMVTNAATRSGGGSAGTFMPSLFIGGCVGTVLALVVQDAWTITDIDSRAFAIVGMAATFAAIARAPLTSIIIVFEITGSYDLVLPLMLATVLATVLTDRLHPASSYTLPLQQRGIHLLRSEDIDLLDTVTVGEVMRWPGTRIRPEMSLAEVDEILDHERHHGMPVLDAGRLVGIITVHDVAAAGGPSPDVTAAEAMTPSPITVVPSMPVSDALARMAALGFGRMPVVADDDPSHFVGMFRRESVVRAYHHALGATTDRAVYRERIKQRTHPGASFYELPVPPGSAAHGRLVKELDFPESATLVSIRRGHRVIIPHGDTMVQTGDTITAFGTSDSRVELAFMLEARPAPDAG